MYTIKIKHKDIPQSSLVLNYENESIMIDPPTVAWRLLSAALSCESSSYIYQQICAQVWEMCQSRYIIASGDKHYADHYLHDIKGTFGNFDEAVKMAKSYSETDGVLTHDHDWCCVVDTWENTIYAIDSNFYFDDNYQRIYHWEYDEECNVKTYSKLV